MKRLGFRHFNTISCPFSITTSHFRPRESPLESGCCNRRLNVLSRLSRECIKLQKRLGLHSISLHSIKSLHSFLPGFFSFFRCRLSLSSVCKHRDCRQMIPSTRLSFTPFRWHTIGNSCPYAIAFDLISLSKYLSSVRRVLLRSGHFGPICRRGAFQQSLSAIKQSKRRAFPLEFERLNESK
jgi:hypothetical protein